MNTICNWCNKVFSEEELTPVYVFYFTLGDYTNKSNRMYHSAACDSCIEKYKEIQEQLTKNALRALGAL